MASAMKSTATVGLCGSSLPVRSRRAANKQPLAMKSEFLGSKAVFSTRARAAPAARRETTSMSFDGNWLKANGIVPVMALFGWTVPSSTPVPAFGDASLTGLFLERIGDNLGNFPVGPSIEDPIWLYMLTWHVGLFTCLLLGQIGFQGRKQGYW
eukprot:CAMPEP_0197846556 /NCGR_PEP_ID=MMETSP1438-20131217/3497_1 /TAXON_ID=1461541 /ORGANISM="Pterosperma sp., Strain CCMP1384" /LENGTH=153 /DNA_ID=CAMNT_0043458247 /DNA_START=49 /DNA_END=510 /DNA_ORIENTATION=+